MFSTPYSLIKSYLKDRSFKVKIELFCCLNRIVVGVSQRSDIAQFLYILYTPDIPIAVNTLIGTYADDTAVLSTSYDAIEATPIKKKS